MSLRKIENSLEKSIVSPKDFFSSKWKFSKKKESLQDKGITKFSYQNHEVHVRLHKDLKTIKESLFLRQRPGEIFFVGAAGLLLIHVCFL